MKKSLIVLLVGIFAVGGIFVVRNSEVLAAENKVDVLFFYGTGCGHCEKVKPTIQEFEDKYEDVVDIHWQDVYTDQEASALFSFYAKEYNIASRGVPTLIIGDKILQGDTPIESGINSALLSCPGDCKLKVGIKSAMAEIRGDAVDTSIDASISATSSADQVIDTQKDSSVSTGSEVPVAVEASLTSEINLTNKIILSIIGVLALTGITIFFVSRNKKDEEE